MNKDDVRRLFPECIEFADKMRDVFGPGVKLTYAEENGRTIGHRATVDPDRVVKLSEIVLDSRPMDEIIAERDVGKSRGKNERE